MTFVAIDLFAGAGGFSTGAKAAGGDVAWAANHWPVAVQVHEANHPDTEHSTQDLHQADWSKVPDHDLILASPACVPGDALIQTMQGPVTASEAKIGTLVLTHEGRERPIVNVWKKAYSGDLINLEMWGTSREKVEMTADHLVWVRRRGGHFGRLQVPRFVRADEVRVGDYVAFPRLAEATGTGQRYVSGLRPPNTSKGNLDGGVADLWWLLGHYLGDGVSGRPDRPEVEWYTGGCQSNLDTVRHIVSNLGLRTWVFGKENNRRVAASSKWLHAVCASFGRSCEAKRVPPELTCLEAPLARALLEGYIAADGSERLICGRAVQRIASVNLDLLRDCQRLAWRLGWSAGISRAGHAGTTIIEGRLVNTQDSWDLQVHKIPHAQSRTKVEDRHVWRSVRSISRIGVKNLDVYDFEVEEDHTFCLPGVIVHNCQGHSRARGKDRAHHDVQRSTAWAVISAAEFHRPEVVLVENVPEFQQWTLYPAWSAAMKALGYSLSPHVIDAADLGVPQHRVRLFIVCTRSKSPLVLDLPKVAHKPARDFVDFSAGHWRPIHGRARPLVAKTLARIEAGRAAFGDRFLIAYYGNSQGGRSLDRPIGTITTRDRYAVIDGDRMRMLTVDECRAAMGFPENYLLPVDRKTAVHLLGNAVCPPVAKYLIEAVEAAA